MSLKRQIRQWKYEINQAWGNVPFGGRIALGAAIAIGLALFVTKTYATPLNQEIAALKKKVVMPESLNPDEIEEIIMNRDKTENLKNSLTGWNARLEAARKRHPHLDASTHPVVISEIQKILSYCRLQLLSEVFIQPEVKVEKKTRRRTKDPAPAPEAEKPFGSYEHQYEVAGSFRQLQAALLLVNELPYMVETSAIQITAMPDSPLLKMQFRLTIRYMK